MGIELGTVGWDGVDDWYVQGTAQDAGTTLVRVQLIQGRDTSQKLKPEIGQGQQLLCQIASGIYRIPDKGVRCYVAIPEGMQDIPGIPVIIATVEKNPTQQYNQDRVMMNFGDDKHIVIRAKSVTLATPTNQFIMVGTSRAGGAPCVLVQDETGSGLVVQSGAIGMMSSDGANPATGKTILQMTASKFEVFQDSGVCLQMLGGNFLGIGQTAALQAGAVYLGALPNPATPALYGLAGPAGVPSPSVFISAV